jgi:hypothetical protein
MLRPVLIAVVLVTCFGSAASADDVMAGYYGNTAIASGGKVETHSVYNADHTFVLTAPAVGETFKGTWQVTGTTLCRTYETAPPGVSNPLCTPVEAHKIGDSWTVTADGRTRTVTLVKGIQ